MTVAIAATITLLTSGLASASTWTGLVDSDWNNAANWDSNPANVNVVVNTTGNYPMVSTAPTFTPVDVFIGDNATGRLDQTTGTLSLVNTGATGNWFFVGQSGGNGTYNLTGNGSLAVGKLFAGGRFFQDGTSSTGAVTVNTTGSITANSTDDFSTFGQMGASVIVGWGSAAGIASSGTLNLQAGTVNANGNGMYVGGWGGNGTVTQTGGTLNVLNTLSVARWFGTGNMSVTNGTVNAGAVVLSHAGAANDLINGTLTVDAGGVVNSENDFVIAFAGNAASQSKLDVNAGTVNVASVTERWMIVGQYDSVNATVDVRNGAALNLRAGTDIRTGINGNNGARVINVDGGSILGSAAAAGDATVIQLARGGAGSDTINITNGGVIAAKAIYAVNDSTSAVINFNNGTLRSLGDDDYFIGLTGTGTRAVNILGGGARIDTNGFNGTIRNGLLAGDALNGGLTKIGAGTLTLIGANTYTGNTVIAGGTLKATYSSTDASAATPMLSGPGFTDLQGGQLVLDHSASTSPIATVRALLAAGQPSNFATGQIRATTSAATPSRGIGYAELGGGQLAVQSTFYGDATLDGVVNVADLGALATNYGATDAVWAQGDFNYDAAVSVADLGLLATYYGSGTSLTAADAAAQFRLDLASVAAANPEFAAAMGIVPEPTTVAIAGLAALAFGHRRRCAV